VSASATILSRSSLSPTQSIIKPLVVETEDQGGQTSFDVGKLEADVLEAKQGLMAAEEENKKLVEVINKRVTENASLHSRIASLEKLASEEIAKVQEEAQSQIKKIKLEGEKRIAEVKSDAVAKSKKESRLKESKMFQAEKASWMEEKESLIESHETDKRELLNSILAKQSEAHQEFESVLNAKDEELRTLVEENSALNSKNLTNEMNIEKMQNQMASSTNVGAENVKLIEENAAMATKIEELTNEVKIAKGKLAEESAARKNEQQKLKDFSKKMAEYSSKSEQLMSKSKSNAHALANVIAERDSNATALKRAEKERDGALERLKTFDSREFDLVNRLNNIEAIRRKLHNRVMQLSGNIRVFVRVRPVITCEQHLLTTAQENADALMAKSMNTKGLNFGESVIPFEFPELGEGEMKQDGTISSKTLLEMTEPFKDRGGLSNRRRKHRFGFDNVLDPSSTQEDVWEAAEPLVQSAVDGHNVCLFAYGQTGSGKTHTMLGTKDAPGLIFRSVEKLFDAKQQLENNGCDNWKVKMSIEMLEVYNERISDLMTEEDVELIISENAVVNASSVEVGCNREVEKILDIAQKKRVSKSTDSNSQSSRSHLIFTIKFEATNSNDNLSRHGKLHICDLCGSERLSKSGAHVKGGALLKETQAINSSLSTLASCVEKLQTGSDHVNFRDSKLTHLLQNSLSGDSKTLALVCCSPLPEHYHESLCSLRLASRINRVELKKHEKISL